MKPINQPSLIKVAAVVTAAPRWVIALLAAEGFLLPETWLGWWVIVSAILSLGMAIVEGFAFSYIFNAWRMQKDKTANNLLWLALFSALVFVGVLTPSISAGVRRVPLGELLTVDWTLHLWSIAVATSTIAIVAGVGYAEKQIASPEKPATSQEKPAKAELKEIVPPQISAFAEPVLANATPALLTCEICGDTHGKSGNPFITQAALNAHMKAHKAAALPVNGTHGKPAPERGEGV